MFVDAPTTAHLDRAAAEELDRDLARLTRSDGRLALSLGEAMERFAPLQGPAKLGYSSRKAYTTQVIGQPARWVGDLCALARLLESLPLTRAALAAGTIETELALLLKAKRTTVAVMKKRLAAAAKQAKEAEAKQAEVEAEVAADTPASDATAVDNSGADDDIDWEAEFYDDEEQLRSTIETTVPLDHVWAYEGIKLLMASAFGVRGDEAKEYLLAEAAVALSMLDPELGVPVAPPSTSTPSGTTSSANSTPPPARSPKRPPSPDSASASPRARYASASLSLATPSGCRRWSRPSRPAVSASRPRR